MVRHHGHGLRPHVVLLAPETRRGLLQDAEHTTAPERILVQVDEVRRVQRSEILNLGRERDAASLQVRLLLLVRVRRRRRGRVRLLLYLLDLDGDLPLQRGNLLDGGGCLLGVAASPSTLRELRPERGDELAHLVELFHQLALQLGRRGGGLLRVQLDHRGVVRESEGGVGVLVKLDLGADGAEEVRLGLHHGVLQVLAEEVRVTARDGPASLELPFLERRRHLHEELRHLREGEVDLLALVLQLLGLGLVTVRPDELVLHTPVVLGNLLVLRVEYITRGLGARQVAHVQPTALLHRRRIRIRLFNLERHHAVPSGALVVKLRR